MKRALYALSGDPITYGHINIIKRGIKLFDEVIVAIGINDEKNYTFSLNERRDMAQKSLNNMTNVIVISYDELLADCAYDNNVNVVIRGMRDDGDMKHEKKIYQILKKETDAGKSQDSGIEMCILFADPAFDHISSSIVKTTVKKQGLVHEYVSPYVKEKLEEKILGQYIVGLTGEMGAGKSYIGKRFEEFGKDINIPTHNIELDHIGHMILDHNITPQYERIRDQIVSKFGPKVRDTDGNINRPALGEIVFNDYTKLEKLNEIMKKPIHVLLRKELYGKQGLIFINAALIAESGMTYLCNNNTVLIECSKKDQMKRLRNRGLNKKQIKKRKESQYSLNQKRELLTQKIESENHGCIWTIENSDNSTREEHLTIYNKIISDLGIK